MDVLSFLLLLLFLADRAPGQPVITQQPQSRTNVAGTTATFTVTAIGTEPVTYQWQKRGADWADLAGHASADLELTNVQTNDAADYRVVVADVQGAATSAVAQLFVLVPPSILTQPRDLAVASGSSVLMGVSATGSPPLSYQWSKEGVDLANGTDRNLILQNVQLTNVGGYTVLITNMAGAVTSRTAQLSVAEGWVFTNARGTRLPYRLFLPPHYDAGTNYPLVMYWHGADQNGLDNLQQLKDDGQFSFLSASNQAINPCFYLAPQLPYGPRSCEEANTFLDCATGLVARLEAELSIDPDRVYVTGFSAGGITTWFMLARFPDLLAAAVPISGQWVCHTLQDFQQSLRVPVWDFHAADDQTVLVGNSDTAVAGLRSAGANVLYTRYQSNGHSIRPVAYSTPGLVDWVMSQRRGVAPSNQPLLAITNPTPQPVLFTGATNLNLAGTATVLGYDVTGVTWTNFANNANGAASGTNLWSATDIPLATGQTNIISVVATTTSWSAAFGGNTTFNGTLAVIQAPLQATLTLQGIEPTLNWTGGGPPYRVQRAADLAAGDWADYLTDATPPVTLPASLPGETGFYRVVGQ